MLPKYAGDSERVQGHATSPFRLSYNEQRWLLRRQGCLKTTKLFFYVDIHINERIGCSAPAFRVQNPAPIFTVWSKQPKPMGLSPIPIYGRCLLNFQKLNRLKRLRRYCLGILIYQMVITDRLLNSRPARWAFGYFPATHGLVWERDSEGTSLDAASDGATLWD